ncbi:ankyrin repeat-containing protein [Kwoniella heveanensis CBS 569]|nr:ankyrin repeat-containing protein [Kwoniella heveanensis CBS 569]
MVQASSSGKNLWVASSDGDLERVQFLIETEGMTPNDKDANSYTPMHAASSYAHFDLLEYLLSKGGDPNIQDDDGDTPLYVVESVEVARWLVEQGADPASVNEEGLTAADALEDDHPEIAQYLRSRLPESARDDEGEAPPSSIDADLTANSSISQLALDNFTSSQSSALMEEAQRIMEECARTGEDPDERLREVVERAVGAGLAFGRGAVQQEEEGGEGVIEGDDSKRAREE